MCNCFIGIYFLFSWVTSYRIASVCLTLPFYRTISTAGIKALKLDTVSPQFCSLLKLLWLFLSFAFLFKF